MLAAATVLLPGRPLAVLAAGPFTVTTTNDTHDSNTGDGVCSDGSACSLRAALEQANASAGATTITLPAGTYNLTLGDLIAGTQANTTITLSGAGAGSTVIHQTIAGRMVFNVDFNVTPNVVFNLSGVTVTGGSENENDPDGFGGNGGAMLAGGSATATGNAVSIANAVFSGNFCSPVANAGCSGGAIDMVGGGSLTVTNSTFSGNVASKNSGFGGGGAIYFDNGGNGGNVSITGSTFTNNVAQGNATTGGVGGALFLAGGSGTTYTVSNNTFTGNAANGTGGAHGGAIYKPSGTLTASFNRIAGNTSAGDASGLYVGNNAGSVATATNDWWGCNGGPSTNGDGCDQAVLGTPNQGGSATFSPWIVLSNTAGPNAIQVGQTSTLTASFLQDSSGGSLTTAQVGALVGVPVAWGNARKGTLSAQQTTIGAGGTATATFTATACGSGGADATVDSGTATGAVTVQCPDLTATKTNDVSGSAVTGQTWTWTITLANSGTAPAAFSAGQTILTDNLPNGSNLSYGSPSASLAGVNCSIDTNDNLSCAAGSAVSIPAAGSFAVSFSAASSAVGSQTNPRSAAVCAVDPSNVVVESNEANNACANTVTVSKADTTTAITSATPDPSVVGQAVTVSYGVTVNTPGAGTPTGNVTVSDGAESCTGTVAAGQCSITFTSAAAQTLTAAYAGDSNFNGSTSAGVAHTTNKADTTTAITSDSPDPSAGGAAVTVTYSVAPVAPGAGLPTGNVTVSDGVDSCTGTVAAGQCDITLTTPGSRTLTATYAGDANFNGSVSAGESHTVVGTGTTTTTITSDAPDPSVVGQAVTVQFSVTPSGATGTPTGNVTVTDGTISCTATVAAGQCSLTFTSAGSKSLTATYAGDTVFAGSTSAAEPHQVNAADTTTSITSDSPDPSVVGQAVTVAFSVSPTAPGAGVPAGNVTVTDGAISCTASVAAGQCSLTFTSAGARSLTATYAGDSNFNGSASAAEAHAVDAAGTTTSITSDAPDPSVTGQSVSVGFSVAVSAPGAGTSTGSVTVSDGTDSCTATVAAGQCSLTFTSAGTMSLTATYAGDSDFSGSVSAAEPHTVNQAGTTTAIVSDAPDPSVTGQSVSVGFSVAVSAPGAGTPTGSVTVSDGTDSCTATVAAGQCSLTFTSAGSMSLTATYAGDSNFSGSVSAAEPHTVNQAGTTTAIISEAPDPSVTGQSVSVGFSVAVSAPGAGTPTGSVTVSDGTDSCTATVAAGQCSLTFTSAGSMSLTATYAGDSNFSGSVSASVAHTVNPASTTTTITSDSPDPSVQNQPVTVAFAVSPVAPGAGTPTGTVTVTDGVDSCAGTVASGSCAITLTTIGSRTLTATYAGDGNFAGSTSAGAAHTVNSPNSPPTIAVVAGGTCNSSTVQGTALLSVTDPDNDPVTLSFTSSNKTVVPNSQVVLGGSGATRTLKVTPVVKKTIGTSVVTITANDGHGHTASVSVTVIVGTKGSDLLLGTSGPDMVFGVEGTDVILAGDGNDLVCGGSGADLIHGGNGNDTIDGQGGSDLIYGDAGNDILLGGAGNDALFGGDGNDTLTGGSGADFFSGGAGVDVATDFNARQGDLTDGTIP